MEKALKRIKNVTFPYTGDYRHKITKFLGYKFRSGI
jgi:hypothetical protein